MFTYISSNSLPSLADVFSKNLNQYADNIFTPKVVLVPNKEMKTWLSLYLAEKNGISANLEFILPSEFLWNLYRSENPDTPRFLPSDINATQWLIYRVLTESDFIKKYKDGLSLFTDTAGTHSSLFDVSGQIADIFDRYQTYRPEILKNWESGKDNFDDSDEKWQKELWLRLVREWESGLEKNMIRRFELSDNVKSLIEKTDLSNTTFKHIHIFGLHEYTRPFVSVLHALSEESELFAYQIENIKTELPDLNNRLKHWQHHRTFHSERLLTTLKESTDFRKKEVKNSEIPVTIPKIQIFSNYSIRREVEVLKDELLRILNKDKSLKSSDILILVPEARQYYPVIEEVFSNDEMGAELPFSQIYDHNDDGIEALLSVISVLRSRFEVTDIVGLLEKSIIREKFDINDTDLELLEKWFSDHKITRGIGSSYDDPFSFKDALNRFFYGAFTTVDAPELIDENSPSKSIHTKEDVQLTVKLSSFLHTLQALYEEYSEDRPLEEWLQYIEKVTKSLLSDYHTYDISNKILNERLSHLTEELSYAFSDNRIPADVFLNWISGKLENKKATSGTMNSGITIGSYIPYRSIPFKCIVLLGCNEGIFPRINLRPHFDLMKKYPQKGDPDVRKEDELLFAEYLQSAGEQLLISFIGRNQKDDSIRNPSILIDQLTDCIPGLKAQEFPLHYFSPLYFHSEGPRTYSESALRIHEQIIRQLNEPSYFGLAENNIDRETDTEIEFSDLVKFFSNPSRFYAEEVLQIRIPDIISGLTDRESYELQGLDRYFAEQMYLEYTGEAEDDQIRKYLHAERLIPPVTLGDLSFKRSKDKINELLDSYPAIQNHTEKQAFSIDVGKYHLSGMINGLSQDHFYYPTTSSEKKKNLIKVWLSHLIWSIIHTEYSGSTYIFKKETKYSHFGELNLPAIDSAEAGQILDDYLSWFCEFKHISSLYFFPESSFKYADQIKEGHSHYIALEKAEHSFTDDYSFKSESQDPYVALITRGYDPISNPAFSENAIRFWEPLLGVIK